MSELTPKGRLIEIVTGHIRATEGRRPAPLPLHCYVVYWSPSDYPGHYVVRRFNLHVPDVAPFLVTHDLSAVLAHPEIRGRHLVGRTDADDPSIWGTFY